MITPWHKLLAKAIGLHHLNDEVLAAKNVYSMVI
jgi:hypothetical protein